MIKVGAVVLAAGQSSRYRAAGGVEATKLIAEVSGKPIIRRVVEAAWASRARPVSVVVGYARDRVEAALAGIPATIVVNPDFATGLASSLRAALSALPSDVAATLVLLGDMPHVDSALINRLIDAFEAAPERAAVAPLQDGRRGTRFCWRGLCSIRRCALKATKARAAFSLDWTPAGSWKSIRPAPTPPSMSTRPKT